MAKSSKNASTVSQRPPTRSRILVPFMRRPIQTKKSRKNSRTMVTAYCTTRTFSVIAFASCPIAPDASLAEPYEFNSMMTTIRTVCQTGASNLLWAVTSGPGDIGGGGGGEGGGDPTAGENGCSFCIKVKRRFRTRPHLIMKGLDRIRRSYEGRGHHQRRAYRHWQVSRSAGTALGAAARSDRRARGSKARPS